MNARPQEPPGMRTEAVRIHRHGGPEVLQYETIDVPGPALGEVLVRQTAIGLNYADIYQREGGHGPHESAGLPIVLGSQGAGIVEAVGSGVTGFHPGDRVASISPGAYSVLRNVPADRLLQLPDGFAETDAAASLLRGLTAEYLLRRLGKVKPGDTVLVHAAAGGMGLILGRWGQALGARMIGTVGSDAKIPIAAASGYEFVINYATEDFVARVDQLTGRAGVDVVLDGVGKAAFLRSLDCVRPMGLVISYGTASGDVGAFDLQLLHRKSIIVTRPTLRTWIAKRSDYETAAAAFFAAAHAGTIPTAPERTYPLADVQQAHHDLESRNTTGPAVLLP